MPLPLRRSLLVLLVTLVVVGIGLGVLLAWQAVKVNSALQQAVDDAASLKAALEQGDDARVEGSLASLQESSALAEERTDGVLWSLGTFLPVVGDDIEGVRVASRAVADLASEEGAAPVVRVATRFDDLVPRDGKIDLSALEALQQPTSQAADALSAAVEDLSGPDSSGFIQRFRDPYRELLADVSDAAGAMSAARVATDLLPVALGADGPRNYLLVFQNNAEIRATGGLPGAMAAIRVEDGELSLGRQASASSFGERAAGPVLELTRDERAIWGEILGTYALDANFTPDWPRAAELLRARWEETYPERFDGVLTLDTVAVSYLLDATGGVSVGDYEITGDNAVDVLLNQVYLDIEDPRAQDALFQAVASAVFEQFRSGQVSSPRAVLDALRHATEEGRLYVNLTDDDEQARILERRISGSTTDADGRSDRIDVTLLDGTGSKMSYYMRFDVEARPKSCADGAGRYTIGTTIRSVAPPDAADLPRYITGGGAYGVEAGTTFTQARVFTPSGGTVRSLMVNGNEIDIKSRRLGDRGTASGSAFLEPGEVSDILWEIEVPDGSRPIEVQVTPGLEDEDESTVLRPACG